MTKKTKEEIRNLLAKKGEAKFPIKISLQAANFMKHLDWTNTEWDNFVSWFIKEKLVVGGGHILQYLELKGE